METILMLADNVLEKMDGLPFEIVVKLPDCPSSEFVEPKAA